MGKEYNLTQLLDELDSSRGNTRLKEEAMKNEIFLAYTMGISEEKARGAVRDSNVCETMKTKLYSHIEEIQRFRRESDDRRRCKKIRNSGRQTGHSFGSDYEQGKSLDFQ